MPRTRAGANTSHPFHTRARRIYAETCTAKPALNQKDSVNLSRPDTRLPSRSSTREGGTFRAFSIPFGRRTEGQNVPPCHKERDGRSYENVIPGSGREQPQGIVYFHRIFGRPRAEITCRMARMAGVQLNGT